MPSICAIVVNWNAPQLTSRAIRSLLGPDAPDGLEVLAVDNGSDDGSAAILEAEFAAEPRVRVLALPENLGFGGGANAGIRASEAELVALLNNDATAEPGWLAALAAAFAEPGAERLGAATSRILLAGRWRELAPGDAAPGGEVAVLADAGGRRVVRDDARGIDRLNSTGNVVDAAGNGGDRSWLEPADAPADAEVFGFCGGAAMLRRAALQETGLFDERLFMYYEDTDLSWRLRKAGWGIRFVDGARVRHEHAASSGSGSGRFLRWNARNRVLVAVRHGGPRMAAAAIGRTLARAARTAFRPARRVEHRAVVAALGELLLGRRGR